MRTNNIIRFLLSRKIVFEVLESEPVKRSAVESAERLGVDPRMVYKSIVLKRAERGKPIVVVIPGPASVDLKKVAALLGEKKLFMTTQSEAEKLTGMLSGGISPLGLLHKRFSFVVDASAVEAPAMILSGGERGLSVRLRGRDLIDLIQPAVGWVTAEGALMNESPDDGA